MSGDFAQDDSPKMSGGEKNIHLRDSQFVNLQSSLVRSYSLGTSANTAWGLRGGSGGRALGCSAAALASARAAPRSSNFPKIILPAVVCSTEVTEISTFLPIILRALSTTTMVPSSR